MTTPRSTEWVGSHRGYSLPGQVLAVGMVPWAIVVIGLGPVIAQDLLGWVSLIVGLAPLTFWLIVKAFGQVSALDWFWRPPSKCAMDASGIRWSSSITDKPGDIAWADLDRVERRGAIFLDVINGRGAVVGVIPADVQRLRPADRFDDYSFAMAVATVRPQEYVVTGPTGFHLPLGLRRREPGEAASVIDAQPIKPVGNLAIVIYLVTIFAAAFVSTLMRH